MRSLLLLIAFAVSATLLADTPKKPDDAIAELERRLAQERTQHGTDSEVVADTLGALAERHAERGDFEAARKALDEVLGIKSKRFGAKHWKTTDARLNLADLDATIKLKPADLARMNAAMKQSTQVVTLYRDGKFTEALPLARQAGETLKSLFGERHRAYIQVLFNTASQLKALGRLAEAEKLLTESGNLYKETIGAAHPDYAQHLQKMGQLYEDRRDFPKAAAMLEEAAAVRKSALGEAHADYGTSLHLLAGLYRNMGDFARAEDHERRGLEIRRRTLGADHPLTLTSLNALGIVLNARGDLAGAERAFREAAERRKKVLPPNHPQYATTLNNLATVYDTLGDRGRAETLLKEVLEIRRQTVGVQHRSYGIALNNLGVVYTGQQRWEEAEKALREALAVLQQDPKDPNHVRNLTSLGYLFHRRGDYDQSAEFYERALKAAKSVFGENHPEYATQSNNLGVLYLNRRDYVRAKPLLERTLALREKQLGPNHPLCALGHSNLGVLALVEGDANAAVAAAGRALLNFERYVDATFAVQSDHQRRALLAELRGNLDLYLTAALAAGVDAGEVYSHVLKFKGATLTRAAEERQARANADLSPLFAELQKAREKLARLTAATPSPADRATWATRLSEAGQRKEELEQTLADRSQEFRHRREQATATTATVSAALPAKTVLIDFLVYADYAALKPVVGPQRRERSVAAFIVGRDRKPTLVKLGPAEQLERNVAMWRTAVAAHDEARIATLGAALAAQIWKPLAPLLSDTTTILTAPEGALCQLPLAALPRDGGGCLIEDFTFGRVPSGAQLLGGREARSDRAGLLAIGDIDYGVSAKPEAAGFIPLPGTRREAEAIRALFAGQFPDAKCDLLTGTTPNRQQLQKSLTGAEASGRYRFVHFAGHGYYSAPEASASSPSALRAAPVRSIEVDEASLARNPLLRCGLALAGANRGPDGVLTAEEVSGWDLRGCDLVVLSACETALGLLDAGEGALGLTRAFHLAGCRHVVASLWKVNDAATAALMAKFYHELWVNKREPLAALREAQLTIYHHPELIPDLAGERGAPKAKEALSASPAKPRAARAETKLWAAFVLSGVGK